MRVFGSGLCAALMVVSASQISQAGPIPTPITLADNNAVADFDPHTADGQFSFTINGIETLARQWFFVRIGDGVPESPLNALTLDAATPSDLNGDSFDEQLVLEYSNASLDVTVTYELVGNEGPSETAAITELIEVRNVSGAQIELNFFQLVDFDLPGGGDDTATVTGSRTVAQTDGATSASEIAVTGSPLPHIAVGEGGEGPGSLFDLLSDGVATELSLLPAGPFVGNAAWAYQWTQALEDDEVFTVSKIKEATVPEPASLVLLAGGAALIGAARRRTGA